MPNNALRDYTKLRQSLEQERVQLVARLQALNTALGDDTSAEPPTEKVRIARPRKTKTRKAKRAKNTLSLREAILQAVKAKPLTKEEIHAAVVKLGYAFSTNKPLASISTVIYGTKPKFKNQDGRFSVA